ncbi:MAG: V-type ATP synthase subunit F [Lachnospiraceae bacterium]|nr:V-type ATP synthase subunit F [Lachnospiraceae bacterium]
MYKLAVVGDYDSIYGFAALGLAVCPADSPEAALKEIKSLAEQEVAVIYLTEALATALRDELNVYEEQLTPAIIPIPGISGNTGEGIARVKRSVERAVGSDIIFKEDR